MLKSNDLTLHQQTNKQSELTQNYPPTLWPPKHITKGKGNGNFVNQQTNEVKFYGRNKKNHA